MDPGFTSIYSKKLLSHARFGISKDEMKKAIGEAANYLFKRSDTKPKINTKLITLTKGNKNIAKLVVLCTQSLRNDWKEILSSQFG